MRTVWRCPRCGAVAVMEPQQGDELVAVYDLCTLAGDPHQSALPVRMERVVEPGEIRAITEPREPVLAG